jgi:hypothetical protein
VNVPIVPLGHACLSPREAVRAILAAHPPLAKPLSAAAVRARLPRHFQHLTEGAIRYHMREIWNEAKRSA